MILGPLREILEADDIREEFYVQLVDWGILSFTSPTAFFVQGLIMYLLLHFLYRRLAGWQMVMVLILGLFAGILFRAFLEEGVIATLRGYGNYNPDLSWSYYVLDNLYYSFIFCSLGMVFYFVQLARHNEAQRQQFASLQRESELKFLRSQVNPHFLFNTLNNLYALVNRGSDQALPALEKLSGLLRYSLYEREATVPLAREIRYLEDLLHLESMRIDALAPVDWRVGTFSRDWQLPPLLLVPFVENAFKHGDLRDPEQPLRIQLSENENGALSFSVSNLIKPGQQSKDGTGGIGLRNVQKRLQLLYPDQHHLHIEAREQSFEVHLLIYPQESKISNP
ncbi:MAG: histidine kinase [Bacteroidota bacterium]